MVRKKDSGERGAMKIVAPGFQGMDDAEEFAVINFIIPLSRVKGNISTGVPFSVHVLLLQNASGGPF